MHGREPAGDGQAKRRHHANCPSCDALSQGMKLIYKRYASLYFVAGVDPGDNELITLEIIHKFVEVRTMGMGRGGQQLWCFGL
jgi:hypothetical protein